MRIVRTFARRDLLVLAVALAALACGGGDEARFSVRYNEIPGLPHEALTVTVTESGRNRLLVGEDIGSNERQAPEFPTGVDGTLRVAFELAPSGATASRGAVEVPLRPDWRYGFDIFVDSLNPALECFGCQGSRAFPLAPQYRRSARDSVWLVWGGNWIKHPVIY